MAGSETIAQVAIPACSAAFLALLAYLGARNNQRDQTTAVLLVDERKVRVECEKSLRDAQERHHAALESVEAERDAQKQRADLLEIELKNFGRKHRP